MSRNYLVHLLVVDGDDHFTPNMTGDDVDESIVRDKTSLLPRGVVVKTLNVTELVGDKVSTVVMCNEHRGLHDIAAKQGVPNQGGMFIGKHSVTKVLGS